MREGEEKVEKRVNARAEQVIKIVGEALVRQAVVVSPWVGLHGSSEVRVELAKCGGHEAGAMCETKGVLHPEARLRNAFAKRKEGDRAARPFTARGAPERVDVEPLSLGVLDGRVGLSPALPGIREGGLQQRGGL